MENWTGSCRRNRVLVELLLQLAVGGPEDRRSRNKLRVNGDNVAFMIKLRRRIHYFQWGSPCECVLIMVVMGLLVTVLTAAE